MYMKPPSPEPVDPYDLLMKQLIREERFIHSHQVVAQAIIRHLIALDLARFTRNFVLEDAASPSQS